MMRDVTIRPYRPSDLGPCRGLWAELTQHHRDIYKDPSIGGDTPGLFFDRHLARVGAARVWVAERGGKVVGLTGLILDSREAEVEPLVVTATQRGQGIGWTLVKHAIEQAKKMGVRYLSVRPVARNTDAMAFFHGVGFRTLGHIEMFMDLDTPSPGSWKPGAELFGHAFRY